MSLPYIFKDIFYRADAEFGIHTVVWLSNPAALEELFNIVVENDGVDI